MLPVLQGVGGGKDAVHPGSLAGTNTALPLIMRHTVLGAPGCEIAPQ